MSHIVEFYSSRRADSEGRQIEKIWGFSPSELEDVHDYIQWLFPLPEASAFNWDAPILTADDIRIFRADDELKKNLSKSFDVMLAFYGFRNQDQDIVRGNNYPQAAENWITPGDHNFLRLTRILRSMSLLGLETEAAQFLRALEVVYKEQPRIVGNSIGYWRAAVNVNGDLEKMGIRPVSGSKLDPKNLKS